MSFNSLIEFVRKFNLGIRSQRLTRTPLMQKQYEDYKKGKDLHAHVMEKYLKHTDYNISLNMFPFDIESNVSHYLLWIRDNFKLDIDNYVNNYFNKKKAVIFTNPQEWKSIPSVTHHHIFVEEYTISKL